MQDFQLFLREAHRRKLRVITELVLNHTSDQHPWFQRARAAPRDSRWRDFYVWSDTPERYREARIIFQDFETSNWAWDPVAQAYYWHRFYSHQPDLNYESADVRQAMRKVVDFWFGLGVDGLRLDAVPYLYEREGTSCENLPETHAFLRELRAPHRRASSRPDAARRGEPVAGGCGRLLRRRRRVPHGVPLPGDAAAVHGAADGGPLADHRHPRRRRRSSRSAAQWALFLRNHDELTLEMVTDEERDYMYRVYARRARARGSTSGSGGDSRRCSATTGARIELMNGLLFSLPGTPILYYGDEIGMGDNIFLGDRNGVRTPMQWTADRNAGFSRANPQRLSCPRSSIRNTTTRRSTSRRSSGTASRCSGGCAG